MGRQNVAGGGAQLAARRAERNPRCTAPNTLSLHPRVSGGRVGEGASRVSQGARPLPALPHIAVILQRQSAAKRHSKKPHCSAIWLKAVRSRGRVNE